MKNPASRSSAPTPRIQPGSPVSPSRLKNPASRIWADIAGIATGFALTLITFSLVISAIGDDSARGAIYEGSLACELLATLLFAPVLVLTAPGNVAYMRYSAKARRRTAIILRVFSLALAAIGALRFIARDDHFLAAMVFVVYPATLIILACACDLIPSFSESSKVPDIPDAVNNASADASDSR